MATEAKTLQVGQQFTYEGKLGVFTIKAVKVGDIVGVRAKGQNGEMATFMFPPTAPVEVVGAEPRVAAVAPHETSVEELEQSLRAGFRSIILEADTFRPLADHVLRLMQAAYEAGRRDEKNT